MSEAGAPASSRRPGPVAPGEAAAIPDRNAPAPPDPVPASVQAALVAGRLRLAGLDPWTRRIAVMLLAVIVTGSGVVVLSVAGGLPGPVVAVPGPLLAAPAPVDVPILGVVGFLLGAAATSGALAASAVAVPRRSTPATLLLVAGAGAAMAIPALVQLDAAVLLAPADPLAGVALAAGAGGALVAALALAALALLVGAGRASHALPGLPGDRPSTRFRAAAIVLAAAPGLGLAAAFVAGLAGSWVLPVPAPAGFEAWPPEVHLASAAIAASLHGSLALGLPLLLTPIVLWQATTWARASRAELAAPIVRRVDRAPFLLVALVAGKLAWLVLGLGGWLPATLGGAAPVWAAARGDGLLAWGLAAVFAVAAGAWLARPDAPGVDEAAAVPGTRLLVAGFSAGAVVGVGAVVAASVLLLLPGGEGASVALVGLVDGAIDVLLLPLQLGTVAVALAAGVVLLARGRAAGAFLLVAVAWMAPRAVFVTAVALGLVPADAPSPAGVELATLDAAMTAVIAVLAVARIAGIPLGVDPAGLALALVVSTLLAHGGTLVPPAAAAALAASGVVLVPTRGLLFGSQALNEPAPGRPARVLGSLGRMAAAVLLVAGTFAIAGVVVPPAEAELGRVLLAPPFSAFLVAAAITARRREAAHRVPSVTAGEAGGARRRTGIAEPDLQAHSRPGRRTGLAAGAGAGAVLAAGLLGGFALDPLAGWAWTAAPGDPSSPPAASPIGPDRSAPAIDDGEAFATFLDGASAELDAVGAILAGQLADASGEVLAAAADTLAGRSDRALAWLDAQAVRACFRPYADAVRTHLETTAEIGRTLAAALRGSGPEADATAAMAQLPSRFDALEAALVESAAACGLVPANP